MNLQTSYMGLPLKNPLMVSSCPLSENLDCLRRMEDAGAAGIVLFSLFEEQLRHDDEEMAHFLSVGAEAHGGAPSYFPALEQYRAAPDEYLEHGEIVPVMELSRPSELRLPMMWIALLRSQIGCSLAGSTGVHGVDDMVKYLMAGADIAMVSSAVLANGIPVIEALLEDLATWLDRHGYESVDQIRGCMAQHAVADPSAFQRANYIKALQSYDDQGCE